MIAKLRQAAVLMSTLLSWIASASAAPIDNMTYTYDLSTPDMDPGGFEAFARPHEFADDDIVDNSDPSQVTTAGMLTDGNLGSLEKVPFTSPPMVIFANGTYAGFRGEPGIGHAPKPKIDVDLGGTYNLNSFTLHYLVEDATSIYSPRPVPDEPGEPLFNALTVYGSTDGENFEPLGFSNEFTPLFGVDGDVGSGAEEVRTATIALNGSTATHLSIDVRTPWAFIFISEFVIDAATTAAPADFDGDGDVDGGDFLVWQRNFGGSGPAGDANDDGDVDGDDLAVWKGAFGASETVAAAIPEPASKQLITSAVLVILGFKRWSTNL